jgi:hypothetical protein
MPRDCATATQKPAAVKSNAEPDSSFLPEGGADDEPRKTGIRKAVKLPKPTREATGVFIILSIAAARRIGEKNPPFSGQMDH